MTATFPPFVQLIEQHTDERGLVHITARDTENVLTVGRFSRNEADAVRRVMDAVNGIHKDDGPEVQKGATNMREPTIKISSGASTPAVKLSDAAQHIAGGYPETHPSPAEVPDNYWDELCETDCTEGSEHRND